MKKILVALAVACILAIAAVYIFIPKILVVEEVVKLPCVPAAAFRNLSDEHRWNEWWPSANAPDSAQTAHGLWHFSNNQYSLSRTSFNILEILIGDNKEAIASQLALLSIPTDSTLARWHLSIDAGLNPISRILAYQKALPLKKDMHTILLNIQAHLSNFKNVYGVTFYEGHITDTLLVTTKSYTGEWPSVDYVYSRIEKLKQFCSKEGCSVTGTPMLNVSPLNPSGYQVMLGLPVNRFMPAKDSVEPVKLVGDKFVIADVTGGLKTVAHIHEQMRFYFQDYSKILMAIPFDYLITDRQKEPDTSKWKTRILSPVFHN